MRSQHFHALKNIQLAANMVQKLNLLPQWIDALNQKNAMMFESDGWFIHMANGSVLFKFTGQKMWRFKPCPANHIVCELLEEQMNKKLDAIFSNTVRVKQFADAEI